jgi:hypothetical protein
MASIDCGHASIGEAEQAAIWEQLERLFSHPVFKNSLRCQNLLRYVVDHSLRGDCSQIKERTLGIEVFDRKTDYDMSQDHVVRSAAAEVRKKLAQYYQEPGRESEIIISLVAGAYIPEFRWPRESPKVVTPRPATIEMTPPDRVTRRKIGLILTIAVAVSAMVAVSLRWESWIRKKGSVPVPTAQSSAERFWKPMFEAPGRILICVGEEEKEGANHRFDQPYAFALARLAGYLGEHGRSVEIRSSSSISSSDLDEGPSILIGEFVNGNSWAITTVKVSRGPSNYSFRGTPGKGPIWIEDSGNPAGSEWSIESQVSPSKLKQDYVLILRHSGEKNSPSIVVAGLGENGTIGGINCLVNTKCLDGVFLDAPSAATADSLDLVFSVPIIDGMPTPAQNVAKAFRQIAPLKK